MMPYPAANTIRSRDPSTAVAGMRGTTTFARKPGTILIAAKPTPRMKAAEATTGTMKLMAVGSSSASSSDSRTSAMTSSITAAAMISWPVGVDNTCASCSTLSDIPIDVGARLAPTASAVFVAIPKKILDRPKPSTRGPAARAPCGCIRCPSAHARAGGGTCDGVSSVADVEFVAFGRVFFGGFVRARPRARSGTAALTHLTSLLPRPLPIASPPARAGRGPPQAPPRAPSI